MNARPSNQVAADHAALQGMLLRKCVPEAILVDTSGRVLSQTDGANRFLKVAHDDANAVFPDLAIDELRNDAVRVFDKAKRLRRRVTRSESAVVIDAMTRFIRTVAEPAAEQSGNDSERSVPASQNERWLVTFEDVTEHVLIRRGMERENARLTLALRASEMGVFDWYPDSDRLIANDVLCRLIGLREGSLVRGDQFFAHIHADDVDDIRRAVTDAFESGDAYAAEFRVITGDGDQIWLAARGQPCTDTNGIRRLVGVNWDVTPRRHLEQSLAQSRREVEVAMTAGRLGAWRWDIPNDSVWWSDSLYNVLGYRDSEFGGTLNAFTELLHPEDQKNIGAAIESLLEGDSDEYHIECRLRHRDGRWLWIIGDGALERDDNGQPLTLIGAVRDVTQQKEAERRIDEARKQAEAANQSKSAFLANMSHEIRTPMTAILGYTDLAQSTTDPEEREEHLRTIRRNGHYLLEIINDILDLSKIEAGKIEIAKRHFAPISLVSDVQSIMHVRAQENDLNLSVDYEGELPETVRSDPKRLKQILINLVGNAIKFTKQGSVSIRVRYLKEGKGYMEFDVVDTGIGMNQRQQDALFQPFTQGDARINRDYGGTGLGLAISQRLAKILGGKISVESRPDQGSRFTCRVLAEPSPGVSMVEPNRQLQRNQNESTGHKIQLSERILVVDDRADIRFLSKRILVGAGATVIEAVDGLDALDKVNESLQQQQSFDCIVLDMQMPRLDGYRTAERLRAMGFQRPILALTAEAMDGDSNRCLESGCDDYLSKPINRARLLTLVAQLTQR